VAFAADVLVVQGGVVRAVVTSSFCSSYFFDAFGATEGFAPNLLIPGIY